MPEALIPPPVEVTKVETPGLAQTRQLIQRYRDIVTSDEKPNLELVNGLLKRNGLEVKQLVKDTYPSSIVQSDVVVRTDVTNTLLDKLIRRGGAKLLYDSDSNWDRAEVETEAQEFDIQSVEQRVNQDFDELKEILQFQQYINQTIEKTDSPFAYKALQQKMTLVVDMYKVSALYSLLKRGDELFAGDILGKEMPYLKDGLERNALFNARGLQNAIKALMIASDSTQDDLRKDYVELLWPLGEEKDELFKRVYDTKKPFYINSGGITYHYKIAYGSRDLPSAIKNFSDWMRGDNWKNLIITPEQIRKIYDTVHIPLLRNLYAGGHESIEGTEASNIFYNLRDPRVLPHLITFLRQAGAGHTSNSVVYSIQEIVKNPLDEKSLEQVLTQAQPFQKRVLNNWFTDSSRAEYKIFDKHRQSMDGYHIANMVSAAETYLVRGDLVNIASVIAKSQGQDINWEAMEAFFLNNIYIDSSWVENTLLGNLDEVGIVIAKSKIADWRFSSQKVFNALISPADGSISRFPKLIASEGLGLGQEDLDKLEKLYQSGDLRRGVMARAAFAEGLLFLSSKGEGFDIAKDILDTSTGASRDSERIRAIFSLLRSLDSFGRFEFSKKGSLGEIISDLKNKLVTTVAEKMELQAEETPILHERLDFLMTTGVFEIIPHLLARFQEQKKSEVANVVREIGRHIVLGDFRQWRNSLDTAVVQLSILALDKQALWTSSIPEVSLAMGVNKEVGAKQGALDAIKRIASEAKAHILDVYKLDFSAAGINVLKQKQADLIQALKDNTKSNQERKELGESKRSIDDQIRITEGLLGLENLSIDNLDPMQLSKHIAGVINSIRSFKGLDQAVSDLTQITEVLTTQAEIGNITKLRAYDTDDPLSLLKVGIEPRETCQSYRNGSYNFCLPAYVADANKRIINVENDKGEVLGRSVMKLTHIRDDNGETHPVILLEPIYTTSEIGPIYRGVVRIALEKAKAVGAYLILTGDTAIPTGANNERTIPVMESESKKMGMQYERGNVDIFIPKSANPYEYSDSLGGAISYFETYRDLPDAVVVKP